jgi:hypothetical protein
MVSRNGINYLHLGDTTMLLTLVHYAYPRYRCFSSMHTEYYARIKSNALSLMRSLRPLMVAIARRSEPPEA